jgi:hypothetical protein
MLREIPSHSLFTILMVVGFLAIALAKAVAPKRFHDFLLVLGNSKYLKIYSRDQKFLDYHDAFLFVNLIITATIFSLICIEHLATHITINLTLTVKFLFGVTAFILAKVLLERLIASLFEIDAMVDAYLFQKISYKNYIGLILLPINALLTYSITPNKLLLQGIIILILLLNTSGLITTFKGHQNEIKKNLFYFILYLCALEIAPYIVIYSIFSAS